MTSIIGFNNANIFDFKYIKYFKINSNKYSLLK